MRDFIGEIILEKIGTHFAKNSELTKEQFQKFHKEAQIELYEAWDFE